MADFVLFLFFTYLICLLLSVDGEHNDIDKTFVILAPSGGLSLAISICLYRLYMISRAAGCADPITGLGRTRIWGNRIVIVEPRKP